MTTLQPISGFGVSREFFKITNGAAPTQAFTYYTFAPEGKWSLQSQSHWELVGIHFRLGDETLPLAVRFLHIEEEDLLDQEEQPDYEAERDAGSFVSVGPVQMEALLTFFEGWARTLRGSSAPLMPKSSAEVHTLFRPLPRKELVALGITEKQMPLLLVPDDTISFYRYVVASSRSSPEKISVLYFEPWSSRNPHTARAALGFNVFVRDRMPTGASGGEALEIPESVLSLDAAGTDQLVHLLQQHRWSYP